MTWRLENLKPSKGFRGAPTGDARGTGVRDDVDVEAHDTAQSTTTRTMKQGGAKADPDDAVFFSRAVELKEEGNVAYQRRDYKTALAFYDQSLGLLGEKDEMRAQVYSNKAACYYQMRFYADVVAEASKALRVDAKSHKAMFHRANAYASLGNAGKAKKDYANVLALDSTNIDAKKALDRLNGVNTKEAPAGLGGMNLAPAKKAKETGKKAAAVATPDPSPEQAAQQEAAIQAAQQAQQQQPPPIALKCVFGDDVRMFNVFSTLSYRDLVTSIATKFPAAGQFSIKFEDMNGGMQTIQATKDFQTAIFVTSQRLNEMEKPPLIPYVKLFIQDLPKIEDIALVDENGNPAGLAPNEVVEIDEWILDFAALFREHLGIDAEGHLEPHQEVRFIFWVRPSLNSLVMHSNPPNEAMTKQKTLLLMISVINVLQMSFAPIVSFNLEGSLG